MSETMFDHVGGMPFFSDLVDRFYEGVESDSVLRPLYPEDLEPGKQALAYFLAQYWGGPTTYSDVRGHPRLRMRHFPFRIATAERNAWVHHMTAAVESAGLDEAAATQMLEYFAMAADHLVNAE
ncbi:MAG: globin [Actinomycetota bacterium]